MPDCLNYVMLDMTLCTMLNQNHIQYSVVFALVRTGFFGSGSYGPSMFLERATVTM